jgi:hypothetical protein
MEMDSRPGLSREGRRRFSWLTEKKKCPTQSPDLRIAVVDNTLNKLHNLWNILGHAWEDVRRSDLEE